MRKLIILLLCCGLIICVVGCGDNTAQPPTESPPTTVLESVITETSPITAVEPTEKEKEPIRTESKAQETEPTTTVTESPTVAKPKEETPLKIEEPQEEICVEIQWPEVNPADIERLVIEKINVYRTAQGDTAVTMLPGLTEVARYRANELTTNFEHRGEQHVSTELKYGQYVDLAPYGLADHSYYKGYSREAIGIGDWFGTAESMSDRIADGFYHSKGHWAYVGNSKYPYIAVGVTKSNGKWCVCILMSDDNYGG